MKKAWVCVIIPILLSSMSLAQEDTWTRKADMSTTSFWLSSSVVDGKIYAIGGLEVGLLFSLGTEFQSDLDDGGNISVDLLRKFRDRGISVSDNAEISVQRVDEEWRITDEDNEWFYIVRKNVDRLGVYSKYGSTASEERVPLSTVEIYNPQTDTWTKGSNMPTPRGLLSTSVVDGKIYAIGGSLGDPRVGRMVLSTVEVYDPITGSWTRGSDMPTPRSGLSTSVVNGKIYAIGGTELTGVVEEYDPITDTWTQKADMPTPRWQFSTSVVNGRIYAIGGSTMLQGGPAGELHTVEEYDPATDTWTKRSDMPTAKRALPPDASAVNGKIYVIGGATPTLASSLINLPIVDVYDVATDTWSKGPDMPTGRTSLSTSAVNGKIYAIGGEFTERGLSIVEEYDTGVGVRVTIVSPQQGLVAGGEQVAILGSGFLPNMKVTIGGNPLADLKVTDTLITGVTPPGTEGEQNIWITTSDLVYPISAGRFYYYDPISGIVLTGITPTNGRQAGGNTGIITGSGFLSGSTVTIGDNPATDMVVAPTLITFTIPPGTEGTKDVAVTNPDGREGILRGRYTYNPFPVIKKIEPRDGGPLTGRTQMIITGDHFMEGIVVSIGDERAPRLEFFSTMELRLRTPPGAAGAKTVRVMNQDGQEAILEDGFTYNPDPTISSVKPDVGQLEGGTLITITGTGFLPGADVFIEGTEAPYSGAGSSTEITLKTPPSDAGVKDVMVVNPDGQKVTLKDGFTYNNAPVITRVIPDNGRLAGGTEITIQGSGFLPGARVLLSVSGQTFTAASSVELMSASIITAVTPPGRPGVKDVMVLNPDKQDVILQEGFTYNPMLTIISITPNNGISSGGTKVIIEGTGFLLGARVMVGEGSATTMVKDDMTIEAVTPANPPGVWDVRVVNPDTQETIAREGFVSVGELAYNFPNPFQASRGTTFRYVTDKPVQYINVKIFNMAGIPIDVIQQTDSNEVEWHNSEVHGGLYIYLMEVRLEDGKMRQFKNALEVYE